MQDAGLRWGVVFKDPVHIDDAINIKKSEEYDGLYQSLQANCNFLQVSGWVVQSTTEWNKTWLDF